MPNTQLPSVVPGNSAADVANQNFQALAAANHYGRRFGTGIGGLVFGYYGATLQDGSSVADGTITVGGSTTTYVVVDRSNGSVSSATNTTDWNNTTDYMRAARLVSSSTGITTYEDHRPSGGISSGGGGGGGGGGDVVGPSSSADESIAVFDGVTGKQLKDGGKSIAGLRVPSVQSVTSAGTVTPTFSNDAVKITAQSAALTLANPTGTPIDMAGLVICIKDDGGARSITYGTQYRAIGVVLPTTTVPGKTTYLAMIYNTNETTWDVVAVGTQT